MSYNGSVLVFIYDIAICFIEAIASIWFVREILPHKKQGRLFTPSAIIIALIYDLLLQSLEFIDVAWLQSILTHALGIFPTLVYSLLFLKGRIIQKVILSVTSFVATVIVSDFFVAFWMLLGFSMDEMMGSTAIYLGTGILVNLLYILVYFLLAKL